VYGLVGMAEMVLDVVVLRGAFEILRQVLPFRLALTIRLEGSSA